ncbi:PhoD-like phosphatase [Trichoderma ceciliae]
MPWPTSKLDDIYTIAIVYMSAITSRVVTSWLLSATPREESWLPSPLVLSLAGIVSPNHPRASFISIVKSLAPLVAVLDFVYRANMLHGGPSVSFSRVGYVNATHSYIAVRSSIPGPVQIQYRVCTVRHGQDLEQQWHLGPTLQALPATDQVVAFALSGLARDTCYQYRTNSSHSGQFHTTTQHPKQFSFLATSCILPFFPYSPVDHSLRIRGLEVLDTYLLRQQRSPDFMLFLGDFIYADLPKRFGFSSEHYRRFYRKAYSSTSWSPRLRSLPWLHAYDDHEITNDWSGGKDGLYADAINPYLLYQHAANPPPTMHPDALYYTFDHGSASFFVLDTRCCRSPANTPDGPDKTMLGAEQLAKLRHWLRAAPGWKFVVSSVPFTVNFGGGSTDSWAGYRWEREQLLQGMWLTTGVVIISGDRHEHATTVFRSPDSNTTKVIEFSTSPLNQFNQPLDKRLYAQVTLTDDPIYYQPVGQSMFGQYNIDTSDDCIWTLKFDLVVDGKNEWSYELEHSRCGQQKFAGTTKSP